MYPKKLSQPKLNQQLSSTEFEVRLLDTCRFRDGHYKGTIPPDQGVWTPTSGGNMPVTMLFTRERFREFYS